MKKALSSPWRSRSPPWGSSPAAARRRHDLRRRRNPSRRPPNRAAKRPAQRSRRRSAGSGAVVDFITPEGAPSPTRLTPPAQKPARTRSTSPRPGNPHDVAIEDEDRQRIGKTEVISEASASAKVKLEPGSYTFHCTIPGDRGAGMEDAHGEVATALATSWARDAPMSRAQTKWRVDGPVRGAQGGAGGRRRPSPRSTSAPGVPPTRHPARRSADSLSISERKQPGRHCS